MSAGTTEHPPPDPSAPAPSVGLRLLASLVALAAGVAALVVAVLLIRSALG